MSSITLLPVCGVFIFLLGYTFIVGLGLYRAKTDNDRSIAYFMELKSILEELLELLPTKEEIKMTKIKHVPKDNELTLTDLLEVEATEKNYEEVITLIAELAKKTYADYKFLIAKSTNEKEEANFLQVVSNWDENPDLHETIFAKSVDYALDTETLQSKFADRVKAGGVIELGDNATVITDDGTNNLPTGVSPVNSGLEGGEIAIIISFIHTDNLEDWTNYNFPKKEEVNE